MIPFKDDNPTETFPFFTIALIALNVIVFIWQITIGTQVSALKYGAIPASLILSDPLPFRQPIPAEATVLTSMFMHGGLLHLGGNMLYLWIFGNNIEDRLGHFWFLVFYITGGIAAAYTHAIMSPHSQIPMIGASGAISAVLGAYLLLYPRARVHTLIFLGFFVQVIALPALIVIGFWAIIQVVNGVLQGTGPSQGGVAWFAHLGGFLFGMAVIWILKKKKRRRRTWS